MVTLNSFLSLIFLNAACKVAAAWESEWIHGKQPADQGKDIPVEALDERREETLKKDPNPPAWYQVVDFANARFEPVCRMIILNMETLVPNHCSCAFVKPNLVATGAHCLSVPKVTPGSGHAIWVQQQYGKGGEKKFSKYKPNMVLEWWFPSAFAKSPSPTNDIAFLKTADKGSKTYKMLPVTKTGPEDHDVKGDIVWIIGYPTSVAGTEVAVTTSGLLQGGGGASVVRNAFEGPGKEKAVMEGGGSGGPIVVSDHSLEQHRRRGDMDRIKMGVFGVSGQAATAEPLNRNSAIQFSEKLIKVAGLIDAYAGPTADAVTTETKPTKETVVSFKKL